MFALVDTFRNDLILSRHRTIEAAARAYVAHGKALRKYNKGALNGASLRVENKGAIGLSRPAEWQYEEFAHACEEAAQ